MDVELRGPLFDGGIEREIQSFCTESEIEIAREGAVDVQNALDFVLKNPTGYYRSHIRPDGPRIWDSGVIYGPWLEGTGERNRKTRFKGYATFRRVSQELQRKSVDIADRILPSYLRRMQ